MAEIEDNTCITAETIIANPDCFKMKIGLNVTGSTGLLGTTGAVVGTINYALGLCSYMLTFSDVCCFNNMQSLVLALPLNFSQDCYKYTFANIELGPQTTATYIDTTIPNLSGTASLIDIEVANGYLFIIFNNDRFDISTVTDDDTGCTTCVVTLEFTQFNLPLTRTINYCNCTKYCKPIIWYFGSDPLSLPLT